MSGGTCNTCKQAKDSHHCPLCDQDFCFCKKDYHLSGRCKK